jgi:hypothetical protein
VTFAEREDILAAARRIGDIDVEESAVKECYQRNRGRESASCVQTFIHGIARLLKSEQSDIGIFYRQQLEHSLPDQVIPRRDRVGRFVSGKCGCGATRGGGHLEISVSVRM